MSSPQRPPHRLAAVAVATWLLLCTAAGSASPSARAADSASVTTASYLQQRIGAGQHRISALSGAVSAASGRVDQLGSSISALERQIRQMQRQLDANRSRLLKLRDEETAAQTRLGHLQAEERATQSALSHQLVGSYEGDHPDLVSVVLDSSGFDNLLERLAFAQQIGDHDAKVVAQVQTERRAVAAQAITLGDLSVRQQQLTLNSLYERDRLNRTKLVLVRQQIAASNARNSSAHQLAVARGQVSSLRAQLTKLEASSTSADGGVAAPGPGGFTFPMPKGDVSPPATWSLDSGVDIAAPGGTPELAVCSGTVVLHGIGGFGPSAPVLHCDSPLAGYHYVYYGHAGPGHWVNVGTHVSRGAVISEVGAGIVGISSGPHLEIGLADSSGSPLGPATAPQIMSLLRASY